MEASPSTATLLGDHRFDHLLEDLSPEFLEASMVELSEIVSEASALDASMFDQQDRITRAMLISEASDALTMLGTRVLVASPDPLSGPASALLMYAGQTAAHDSNQAAAFYERYRLVPRLLVQALDLHHAEVSAGRTPIAANIRRVLSQVDDYLASPLESDPFANLSGPEEWEGVGTWREQMTSLARDTIRPAFLAYRAGVEDLLAVARDEDHSGLCHIAGGEEIYAKMIEVFTTLPYSPQELHEIGQSQAKGIHADEFREIGQRALGTSHLPEILDRLRNDPTLRYETSKQIVADAETILARAWEASADWFNLRPVGSCEVQEVPAFLAKNAPPAYYIPPASDGSRPGTYFINTYEPEARLRFEAESVAFHEANPGHHFQLTLAAELTDIPEFRKRALSTAYCEGWGSMRSGWRTRWGFTRTTRTGWAWFQPMRGERPGWWWTPVCISWAGTVVRRSNFSSSGRRSIRNRSRPKSTAT